MKKLLLATLIALSAGQADAQYMHDYQSTITIPRAEQPNQTLTKTSDGGYFLITRVQATGSQAAIKCYKLKPDMSVDWQRAYYLPTSASASVITINDVKQTADDGYIACGSIIEEGVANGAILIRFDAGAKFQWFNLYPGVSHFNSVVETEKGGFIAAGGGGANSSAGATLMGTDNAGNPVWSKLISGTKTFPGTAYYGDNLLMEVIRTDKSKYAVVGSTNIFAGISLAYDADALVMTFDESGKIIGNWTYGRTWYGYGYTQLEYGFGIRYDKSKNVFYVLGEVESGSYLTCDGTLFRDAWVFSIDGSDGSVNWSNRYNVLNNTYANAEGYPTLNSIDIGDKQIGFTGTTRDVLDYSYKGNSFITRLNYAGNVIDHRMYINSENQFLWKIMRASPHSFAAGGNTNVGTGTLQVWTVESYDDILEDCATERPDLPQTAFDIDVISSVETDVSRSVRSYPLAEFRFGYNEAPICDRVLQPGVDPTMRRAKPEMAAGNTAPQVDGKLIGGRQWVVTAGEGGVRVSVLNSVGQRVITAPGLREASIVDLSALPAGVYVVRMECMGQTSDVKILLQ